MNMLTIKGLKKHNKQFSFLAAEVQIPAQWSQQRLNISWTQVPCVIEFILIAERMLLDDVIHIAICQLNPITVIETSVINQVQ